MTDPIELYSNRERKKQQAETPTDLQYDDFSDEFRVKVALAFREAFPWDGRSYGTLSDTSAVWKRTVALLRAKHGKLDLSPRDALPPFEWQGYLRSLSHTERILDTLEAPLKVAIQALPYLRFGEEEFVPRLTAAIDRLNEVFSEHDLGYQFVVTEVGGTYDGFIVRSGDDYIHQEAVKPAITILHGAGYDGPLQEFLEAHQELRRGKHKSAANEALKALESTMKSICRDRGIPDFEQATATKLIKLLVDNNVIPKESESFFGGVRTVLESGTPTIRNRQSGHGQGPQVVEMCDYSAAFALNIAAAAIVFLVSSHRDPTVSTPPSLSP
ncbi:MAG: hypothetical protein KDD77_10700 [Caldilineaceae bacterium]|nr:hypothetical protein [Caldilineaceae bacterium]